MDHLAVGQSSATLTSTTSTTSSVFRSGIPRPNFMLPQAPPGYVPQLQPLDPARMPLEWRLQREFGIPAWPTTACGGTTNATTSSATYPTPAPSTRQRGDMVPAEDYEALRLQMQNFQRQLVDLQRRESRDKTLANRRGYEAPPKQERRKCRVCHQVGHLQRDCPLKRGKGKGGPPTTSGFRKPGQGGRRGPPPPPMGGGAIFYVNTR